MGRPRPDTRSIWNANAAAWTELVRAGYDVYRDLVNSPAFFDLLPEVDGLRCLDLGCGEGHNTRQVAALGAEVVGLDIAEVFIQAAAEAGSDGIRYVQGDGAALPFRGATFDAVVAFMSLMDVADPEATLLEVARVLRPGGFVQFSIVHPMTSTPLRRWAHDDDGERIGVVLGDYFHEGEQHESWQFGAAPEDVRARHRLFEVTYVRRTLAGWLNAVIAAGLVLDGVGEPRADEVTAAAHPEVADTRIAPYFLHLRARKSPTR